MTEDMYFLFLISEAHSSKQPLVEAEKQTMHSASIALRAIIELYRKCLREQELNRNILVLSISFDHDTAELYGQYAQVGGQELVFIRRRIDSFQYAFADGRN